MPRPRANQSRPVGLRRALAQTVIPSRSPQEALVPTEHTRPAAPTRRPHHPRCDARCTRCSLHAGTGPRCSLHAGGCGEQVRDARCTRVAAGACSRRRTPDGPVRIRACAKGRKGSECTLAAQSRGSYGSRGGPTRARRTARRPAYQIRSIVRGI